MGLRFHRRIRLLPGVRINLSRRGISTSIGAKGAWTTIGHGKTRVTVGVPGSGLSWTETTRRRRGDHAAGWGALIWWALILGALAWLVFA